MYHSTPKEIPNFINCGLELTKAYQGAATRREGGDFAKLDNPFGF